MYSSGTTDKPKCMALNPGGVRIGTADIYTTLETVKEVADSVVVGQKWQDDVQAVLFVILAEGR